MRRIVRRELEHVLVPDATSSRPLQVTSSSSTGRRPQRPWRHGQADSAFLHIGLPHSGGELLDAALRRYAGTLAPGLVDDRGRRVRLPARSRGDVQRRGRDPPRPPRLGPAPQGRRGHLGPRSAAGRSRTRTRSCSATTCWPAATPEEIALLVDRLPGCAVHVIVTVGVPRPAGRDVPRRLRPDLGGRALVRGRRAGPSGCTGPGRPGPTRRGVARLRQGHRLRHRAASSCQTAASSQATDPAADRRVAGATRPRDCELASWASVASGYAWRRPRDRAARPDRDDGRRAAVASAASVVELSPAGGPEARGDEGRGIASRSSRG